MKKFIFLAALMVFGMVFFSGCATMTGETAGEKVDDATINTQANAIIVKDADARYWKIDVDVRQGTVVLSGFVDSQAAHDRITKKIGEIKGVKSVDHSRLKIEAKK